MVAIIHSLIYLHLMLSSEWRPQAGIICQVDTTTQNKRECSSQIFAGLFHVRFEGTVTAPSLLGVNLELLDRVDLLSRVQPLGAGMSAVLDGVAAVELELVVDGIQALLGELVTAVLYPPGETVHIYSTEQSWYAKHLHQCITISKFKLDQRGM
ncbi:hypothetical protein PAHAL_6G018100 [Panicum hallii]|jgi:hypothetical protein|uniref:Uncharacterized protein n=1 Tax=Panicum hallii TaxID=206008 RepID=A0A2S3HZP2_9POAL|nr:hypothetical protein PAHAL_6G018100 [Panicum hallii]